MPNVGGNQGRKRDQGNKEIVLQGREGEGSWQRGTGGLGCAEAELQG